MDIHVVGGFLGSGKTTTIVAAAKRFIKRGITVGIITNDQGTHLVDTAFANNLNIPVSAVTGGCFCCEYNQLIQTISKLSAESKPKILFAEAVGSCADLVATVIKPLAKELPKTVRIKSFSVCIDSKYLSALINHGHASFDSDIQYLFDKQIEESSILIANKIDLLSYVDKINFETSLKKLFPEKNVSYHSSLLPETTENWVNKLLSEKILLPEKALEIDYTRYATAESKLAWFDCEAQFQLPPKIFPDILITFFLKKLTQEIKNKNWVIGHIKMMVTGDHGSIKISLTQANSLPDFSNIFGSRQHLLFNARVEAPAFELANLIRKTFALCAETHGAFWTIFNENSFSPSKPIPVHRMS